MSYLFYQKMHCFFNKEAWEIFDFCKKIAHISDSKFQTERENISI